MCICTYNPYIYMYVCMGRQVFGNEPVFSDQFYPQQGFWISFDYFSKDFVVNLKIYADSVSI